MVADTERNYRGTNFAVVTLIVLLVLVGGYFLVSNLNDMQDDPANTPVEQVQDNYRDATNPGAQ